MPSSNTILALTLFFAGRAAADNVITLMNSCSDTITPYVQWLNANATAQPTLAPGAYSNVTVADDFWGSIYAGATVAANDTAEGALKAFFSISENYYWIQNDSGFNKAIGIHADYNQTVCPSIACVNNNCTSAINGALPNFNTNGTTADQAVSRCAGVSTPYTVTFCPGEVPLYASATASAATAGPTAASNATGATVHPNGDVNKCLDVAGNVQANGTPVVIYDCDGTAAQNWVFSKGNTQLQLAGTNFCLDVGANPASGSQAKLWECYPDLPQQTFYYTGDNRFAVVNAGLCLDLTNGVSDNGNVMQIWACTDNDVYQIWST